MLRLSSKQLVWQKYIEVTLGDLYCVNGQLYSHADFDADVNAEMPLSKVPNSRFPRFCQFCREKNEFGVEMKTFYGFPYFLMPNFDG